MANEWVNYVKQYQLNNNLTYRQALLQAGESYRNINNSKNNDSKDKPKRVPPKIEEEDLPVKKTPKVREKKKMKKVLHFVDNELSDNEE